jgi:hypothetical protein
MQGTSKVQNIEISTKFCIVQENSPHRDENTQQVIKKNAKIPLNSAPNIHDKQLESDILHDTPEVQSTELVGEAYSVQENMPHHVEGT